jgi:hypothetical protein
MNNNNKNQLWMKSLIAQNESQYSFHANNSCTYICIEAAIRLFHNRLDYLFRNDSDVIDILKAGSVQSLGVDQNKDLQDVLKESARFRSYLTVDPEGVFSRYDFMNGLTLIRSKYEVLNRNKFNNENGLRQTCAIGILTCPPETIMIAYYGLQKYYPWVIFEYVTTFIVLIQWN